MFYVYVLISQRDKQLYVGRTNNLERRTDEHKNGKVIATKYRRPLKLIYAEIYLRWSDAHRREKYLKGGKGHNELKIQLQDILKQMKYKNL